MGYTLIRGKKRHCVTCGTYYGSGRVSCPKCRKMYRIKITKKG